METAKIVVVKTMSFWGKIKVHVRPFTICNGAPDLETAITWARSNFENTKNLLSIEIYEKDEILRRMPQPLAVMIVSKYLPNLIKENYGNDLIVQLNNMNTTGILKSYERNYCYDLVNLSSPKQNK